MKVRTDYDGCPYITAGKVYEVIKHDHKQAGDMCAGAEIVDDEGDTLYILLSDVPVCGHLDSKGVWEVIEED